MAANEEIRKREFYARELRRFVAWAKKWREAHPGWTSRQVLSGEEFEILKRKWRE